MTLSTTTGNNYETLISDDDLINNPSPTKKNPNTRLFMGTLALVVAGFGAGFVLSTQPWKTPIVEDGMVSTADMSMGTPCWNANDEWVCSDELYELRDPSEWKFQDEWREAWRPELSEGSGFDQDEMIKDTKYSVEATVIIPSQDQHAYLVDLAYAYYGLDWGEKVIHITRGMFHEAASHNVVDGTGGAHACHVYPGSIQWGCKNNDGLQLETAELLALYKANNLETVCTLADWYHLLGVVAIKIGSAAAAAKGTGEVIDMVSNFQYGRTDCTDQGYDVSATCGYAERIIQPTATWADMVKIYAGYGLGSEDVVGLMSGHAFGGMGNHGPHFPSGFSMSDDTFDNFYWKTLTQKSMKAKKVKKLATRTQYVGWFNVNDEVSTCSALIGVNGQPMKKVGKKFGAQCYVESDFAGCTNGKDCLVPGVTIPKGCNTCTYGPAPADMLCCGQLSHFKTDAELVMDTTFTTTITRVGKNGEEKQKTVHCTTDMYDTKNSVKCPEQQNGFQGLIKSLAESPSVFAKQYAASHTKMDGLGASKLVLPGAAPATWTVSQMASDLGWGSVTTQA